MMDTGKTEQRLRNLFNHHASHEIGSGEATPFIDIYVNGDVTLQFQYGILNLAATENPDDAREFLGEQEQLTYEEILEGWSLSEGWTGKDAFTLCVETLNQLGRDIDEVTYAVEQDCPSNSTIAWNEIGKEPEPKQGDEVENPGEQLQAVYGCLRELEEEADDVPNPFPLVNFYVDGEKLDYVFGPAVHSLEQHSDEERRKFDEFVSSHPDLEATAAEKSSISVTHYEWTPDSALEITEQVLDRLYDISIDQITYSEIATAGPEDDTSWTEI